MTAAASFDSVVVQLKLARNGTNFNLSLNNLYPTLPYTIESSTNLLTWSTYQTITPATTNMTMTVTNAPGRKNAFYRVNY